MNVIVLAGDKKQKSKAVEVTEHQKEVSDKCYLADSVDNKAFIKIKERYMIEYVIETIRKSSMFDKISVVGPKDRLEAVIGDKIDFVIEGTDSIVTNAILAMEHFKEDKEIMIVTSDIPMITVEALEDFVTQAQQKNADLCYSVVDKKINDERYPEIKRTYARLKEGQFTGGNVFLFNPKATDKCKSFIEKMLEYRKSPAKMAKVLGVGFLLRLALGILTIDAVQKKCEKLLGIKGAVVISEYPEIGNDVDKPSDVEFVLKYLA